jgi:DNA (cytosine-5)-methyltransferase 1
MKVLNLYCGIGGNRRLWGDIHEVTAVEINPKIASIYKDFFPNDKVIICDAHQFLIDHYEEFDFIWSSPPCPTHSTFMNLWNNKKEYKGKKYPDMALYQEILWLKHFFKGKWVVENVISWYDPLIKPVKSGNHYFWSNVEIPVLPKKSRDIRGEKIKKYGFDLTKYDIPNRLKRTILNNLVNPELCNII